MEELKEEFKKIKIDVENDFDKDLWHSDLQNFIMKIRRLKNLEKDTELVQEILLYWADLIGCADDEELAENILDDLYQNGFISAVERDYFWENVHYRQG